MPRIPQKNHVRQRGLTLVVSMIMLVVLTLLVVSAIRFSNTNLKTVANMQYKNETAAAAQKAIEVVMSDLNKFKTPTDTVLNVDINNDGLTDYVVTAYAPVCTLAIPVAGYSASFAASAPQDTYWDIKSLVTDARTGATSTVHQGVRVRLDSAATCP